MMRNGILGFALIEKWKNYTTVTILFKNKSKLNRIPAEK